MIFDLFEHGSHPQYVTTSLLNPFVVVCAVCAVCAIYCCDLRAMCVMIGCCAMCDLCDLCDWCDLVDLVDLCDAFRDVQFQKRRRHALGFYSY